MITARLAMLLLCVGAILGSSHSGWTDLQPSALRVLGASVVGLLAPLFWPGLGPTGRATGWRVLIWSLACTTLAAVVLRTLGDQVQPWPRIAATCAMLLPILGLTHAAAAAMQALLRPRLADLAEARAIAAWFAVLGLALSGSLPMWGGPVAELLSARHPDLLDMVVATSPLVHLAVASGSDLLHTQWLYQNSNLAALPVNYPDTSSLALGYAVVCLAAALTVPAWRLARRNVPAVVVLVSSKERSS